MTIQKITTLLVAVLILGGCKNSKKDKVILTSSSGNINNLSVIIDNDLWQSEVGETLREHLAAPVDGLPQQEPLFSMSQMPPVAFTGFARQNRTFIKVQKQQQSDFQIARDTFARPQTGIFISGSSNEAISKVITENSKKIIQTLKATETKEKQRRISKSLVSDAKLKENLGVSLKFPTAYRYATEKDDFFWIRKDIKNGSMEILVYEVPLQTIDKDTNVVGNIIKMRDSIGEVHVPGPNEGTFMITEEAYAPYLFETKLDGKFAYETKGTWEVKNAFMAGPFVNYAVRDEKNKRYVILEGFVFKPSASKRDHVFELEAILKSAKIK